MLLWSLNCTGANCHPLYFTVYKIISEVISYVFFFCTKGKIGVENKKKRYKTCAVLSIQAISNRALARVRTIIVYARGVHRTIV